jgi:hypothetical protein
VIALACIGTPSRAQPQGQRSISLGGHGLQTAVGDPGLPSTPAFSSGLARIKASGASAFRLTLSWREVAPAGKKPPAAFDPTDPGDPAYRWAEVDRQLRLIVAHGLEPIVVLFSAPRWAEGAGDGPAGTRSPDPTDLGRFATAAARRYSGTYEGLPQVRYWQVWNEPNLWLFLSPQISDGKLVAPERYRQMVNSVAAAVHNVQRDSVVIAGGTAPFGRPGWWFNTPPLIFMRSMLCMSGRAELHSACGLKATFDVWAHHPYADGGPDHHAVRVDNVSVADLPSMRRLLVAARRAGHVRGPRAPQFWVTEFSWDTNPPDSKGVPERLQARWVAEALHRMSMAGVTLVTWFQLHDDPVGASRYQSGLFFYGERRAPIGPPKLALAAFRFPFVAYRFGPAIRIWGRAPAGARGRVVVQVHARRWVRAATLTTDRFGVFSGRIRARRGGQAVRAWFGGRASLAFSLRRPKDFPLESPFGSY